MVNWTRKVQIQDGQVRITLPKRWIEDKDIEDKDKVELKEMMRESALKLRTTEKEKN